MPEIELLDSGQAGNDALVEELVRLVNRAYAVGEAGLWLENATRTGPDEIAEAIHSGGMLTATAEGRIVGCACVRRLGAGTAELSLASVAPERWGSGVGRELVRSAEDLMRSRGVTTMQLELLVPREGFIRRKSASAPGTRGSATGSSGRRPSRRGTSRPSSRRRVSFSSSASP